MYVVLTIRSFGQNSSLKAGPPELPACPTLSLTVILSNNGFQNMVKPNRANYRTGAFLPSKLRSYDAGGTRKQSMANGSSRCFPRLLTKQRCFVVPDWRSRKLGPLEGPPVLSLPNTGDPIINSLTYPTNWLYYDTNRATEEKMAFCGEHTWPNRLLAQWGSAKWFPLRPDLLKLIRWLAWSI